MSEAAKDQNPESLFDSIREYITDAQEIMDRGEFVALVGLDKRVEQICAAVQELSSEEAKRYEADLQTLMESLSKLQAVFAEKRDALSDELSDSQKHHQAAKAYKQSEHTLPREQSEQGD